MPENVELQKNIAKSELDIATERAEEDVKTGRVTTYDTLEEFVEKMQEL